MSTLSVTKFETAEEANENLYKLTEMAKQQLIKIHDDAGVLAGWQKTPTHRQLRQHDRVGHDFRGIQGHAFWPDLFCAGFWHSRRGSHGCTYW